MKLGLGTVQFGVPYGISNRMGQTEADEVARILASAATAGIKVLDTAALYGTSEETLGTFLGKHRSFRVVTKTSKGPDADLLEKTFETSLRNLRVSRVYGLLIHQAEDLRGAAAEAIYARIKGLQRQGLVEKIGVSAYSAVQIRSIFDRFEFDLIQVPVNVLDQRLLRDGTLSWLKKKGVEIHARSAFLQGLLLMEPSELGPYFASIRPHLERLRQLLEIRHLSPAAAALGFVSSISEISTVVCGVNTSEQLRELLAVSETKIRPEDFEEFALEDPGILDPSNWKL